MLLINQKFGAACCLVIKPVRAICGFKLFCRSKRSIEPCIKSDKSHTHPANLPHFKTLRLWPHDNMLNAFPSWCMPCRVTAFWTSPVPALNDAACVSQKKTGHWCSALWPRGRCQATWVDGFMCSKYLAERSAFVCINPTKHSAPAICRIARLHEDKPCAGFAQMTKAVRCKRKYNRSAFLLQPLVVEAVLSFVKDRCVDLAWDVLCKRFHLLAGAKTRASVHN